MANWWWMENDDDPCATGMRGGPDAFSVVYEHHGPAVLRYLRRRLGPSAGEDAAHDVFVRAFAARARYAPERGSVAGWLFGIAVNVASEHGRAESRRLKAIERIARCTPESARDAVRDVHLSPELAASLRRLPEKEREALLLVVWGELSYDETAAALGIPVGTVRSRISRARAHLQDAASVGRHPVPATTKGDARA